MKRSKDTSSIDISLLEEMTQLDYFIVRKPVNSPDFWMEWQEKFGKASMALTALKKIWKTRKLNQEEYTRIKVMFMVYEDVLRYLTQLKDVALNLRGIYSNYNFEFDDEDSDLDL